MDRPEGRLGPETGSMAWPFAVFFRAMKAYYEATGRQDVFDAVYNCMLWFVRNWSGEKKTRYAGCYIIDPMIYCWHVTHDDRLYDFCVEYQNFLREEELFNNSAWAFAEKKLQYNSNHSSAYACDVRLPAMIYTAEGGIQSSAEGRHLHSSLFTLH